MSALPHHAEKEPNVTSLATRRSRYGAAFIDGFLLLIVSIPSGKAIFLLLYAGVDGLRSLGWMHVLVSFSGLVALGFLQFYLLKSDGQTLGKKVQMIRIVDENGENGGFVTNVLLRSWLNAIFSLASAYALIDALFIFGPNRRCLHDYIAGTRVINEARASREEIERTE